MHITLLFLENPLDTFSAEGLLSQKAQFYESDEHCQITLKYGFLTLFPSMCGPADSPQPHQHWVLLAEKNYNSIIGEQFSHYIYTFLSLMRPIIFSSACLPTLLGNADVGSSRSQIHDFPCERLQVEPAATQSLLKMSELQNQAFV